MDVDAQLGHLSHQDHVDEPCDGDADACHVVLPAPHPEAALPLPRQRVLVEAHQREAQDDQQVQDGLPLLEIPGRDF